MSFPLDANPDAPGYPPVRYRGERGEPRARLTTSTAAPDLVGPATEVTYLADSTATDGEFGLYRYVMTGAPTGPGPHFHRAISESFYVLSGTVQLYDGRRWLDAGPGDFLHVPVGGVHGFRNASGRRAEMLLLFAPGAPREAYFEANAARARSGEQLSPHERLAFLRLHDQVDVAEPPSPP